jgi:glycosyltransferase
MKVSIITSVYNNKDTIEDAIKSVLNQNYKNIEYIVIDGGSTDGTTDIIKKYQDKISKFISEPDNGIYDGLNKGIKSATGDVIAFLHSDDVYADDEVIAKVAKVFEKYNCNGVYGDLVYVSKSSDKVIRYWKSGEFSIDKLKKGWMPPHPALFLKKEIYQKYGLFDLNFKIAADYDFMLRILKNNPKLIYIPEVLYNMRTGGESNKSLKNIILKSKEDYKALKKNKIGGINTLIYKNLVKIPQFLKKT